MESRGYNVKGLRGQGCFRLTGLPCEGVTIEPAHRAVSDDCSPTSRSSSASYKGRSRCHVASGCRDIRSTTSRAASRLSPTLVRFSRLLRARIRLRSISSVFTTPMLRDMSGRLMTLSLKMGAAKNRELANMIKLAQYSDINLSLWSS